MEISAQDLMIIIGQQTVQIKMLEQQLQQLQQEKEKEKEA